MSQTNSNVTTSRSTKGLVLTALMTAVTCILAPFAIPIPISPVPISLTNLVLCMSIYILGWKRASVSYVIYLLLGFCGLPVFSGFTGGVGKLAGPTGGYLFGFFFLLVIAGWMVEHFQERRYLQAVGIVLGMMVANLFGTIWLMIQMNINFPEGLAIGVIPYLPGDIIKIIIAVTTGPLISGRLKKVI